MDGEHNQYATLSRRQVALFERNPVCALCYRLCMDMCEEYGGINFELLDSIVLADNLCEQILQDPWNLNGVEYYSDWVRNRLGNSEPAIVCTFATTCVTLSCIEGLPEHVYQLAHDLRGLITGDGNDLYYNLSSAAYRQDIVISSTTYGEIPPDSNEALKTQCYELTLQRDQLAQQVSTIQNELNNMNTESEKLAPVIKNYGTMTYIAEQKNDVHDCTIYANGIPSSPSSSNPNGYPSSSNPNGNLSRSQTADVRTEESAAPKRRGNTEKSLFINLTTTEQEKQRFLSFLREHNLGNSELDAALDNSVTQIIVCFYRVWQQKKLLAAKAGGTAVTRFVNAVCELPLTVDEKAYANILNRMIKSSEKYPDWNGDVRASFA